MPEQKVKAKFIEPMLLLRTDKLTEGAECRYEVKLDGYRALAIKTAGRVQLRSRNDNDLSAGDLGPVKALAPMPDETVIDREVVALDEAGKPRSTRFRTPAPRAPFDILIRAGVM